MLLRKQGVDVNKPRYDGTTPLFMARRQGHTEVAALLLDNGGVPYQAGRTSWLRWGGFWAAMASLGYLFPRELSFFLFGIPLSIFAFLKSWYVEQRAACIRRGKRLDREDAQRKKEEQLAKEREETKKAQREERERCSKEQARRKAEQRARKKLRKQAARQKKLEEAAPLASDG